MEELCRRKDEGDKSYGFNEIYEYILNLQIDIRYIIGKVI